MLLIRRTVLACIAVLLVTAASPRVEDLANAPQDIRTALTTINLGFDIADISVLRAFYEQRSFAPAWNEVRAHAFQAALDHADEDGLDANNYNVPLAPSAAEHDILLSGAFLVYARDLQNGRANLKNIDSDVQLADKPFDAMATLAIIAHDDDLAASLASFAPSQPDYLSLKAALAFYRATAARGGWAALPAGRPDDFADNTPGSMLLRHRLAYEDAMLAADPGANLNKAIKRYQLRHGLEPDGRVGIRTLGELNISASARVMQIGANMERWRWLPRAFEPNFIAINVPDAHLVLTLNGQRVLESRVVVGRPSDPTPILRADGVGITINPPWNVPASIARKEILPKLKANSGYLLSQDMILVDGPPRDPYGLHVNWRAITPGTFPYRLQQHPGSKNALGTIKIELPNRFDVYLHDTPVKSAFALPSRDVSHGCVRVEQILPLASYALEENLDSMEKISNAVSAGQTKYLPLKQRLPVYFLYWTAFTAADGSVQFRPDIYGRDKRLIAARSQKLRNLARVSANLPKCQKA